MTEDTAARIGVGVNNDLSRLAFGEVLLAHEFRPGISKSPISGHWRDLETAHLAVENKRRGVESNDPALNGTLNK